MEYYYDRIFPWYGTGYSLLGLAVAVLAIIGMWKVFEKAGEPGWAAIIPFYNAYVLFKITWGEGWMFLLMLIPIANFVIYIITMVKLARAFNRSSGFAVGLIFLAVIFYCILGFDTSSYIGVPQRA
ncbi:hypothetical protein SDC9_168816 [bioreactor metagenome]|uniref:Signal peptidase I n=1 Tax=bioreactor metagenome TaxID=1076179 RepID=A0A645G3G4_9ZZZZ